MEHRTIGWSIAVAVIAAFGFVAMFAIERETSSRDLAQATSALSEAQRDLESSREAQLRMKERVEQARTLSASRTGTAEELTKIDAAITAAGRKKEESKKAWEAVRKDYHASLAAVRRKLMGTKLPSLKVGDLSLEDVTLKSVVDGMVSLEHSAGLTKVSGDKLPDQLAAALLPGWNPQLRIPGSPEPAGPELTSEKADHARPLAAAQLLPEIPSVTEAANPYTAQRIKLQNDRDALALKIDAANGELQLKTFTYNQLNDQYLSSRRRSKIVSIPPGLTETKAAIEVLRRQLETARQQFNKLGVELQQRLNKENSWTPPGP